VNAIISAATTNNMFNFFMVPLSSEKKIADCYRSKP